MGLISIEAEDFCSYQTLKLKLRKRGLVWIGGENEDTAAAASNGSGKTTLFKAVSWGTYGKTVDERDGDQVIRFGQKCAKVTCRYTDGYVSLRERRKGSPKLFLWKGEEEIKGSKEELQARIDALMGQDWQTFRNVSLYGQRDNKRFIHPETSDKERKDVLHRILRTGIYSVAHKWVQEEALKLKRAADALQVEVDKAMARLEEYDLEDLERQRDEWEESRKRRVNAQKTTARGFVDAAKETLKEAGDLPALETRLAGLLAKQPAVKALQGELEALETADEEIGDRLAAAHTKSVAAAASLQALEKQRAKLETEDGTCPLCSGDMTAGSAAEHVAELDAQLEKDRKALKKLQAAESMIATESRAHGDAMTTKRAALKRLRADLEDLSDAQAAVNDAKRASERAAEQKAQARAALDLAKEIAAEVNPLTEQMERARERSKKAIEARDAAKLSLGVTAEERAHYEFWTKGFSPSGCPSFSLDAVMPSLTERTNYYLETLADGDITMNFSTQRELKSAKGEFRDEIGMEWEIEGVPGHEPSGGQWKKMEIACNFALVDLVASQEGAQSDLLLLDEVFDGLDPEGVDRVGILLQKLRSERSTIMVVSHAQNMQEWFERALMVKKFGGISSCDVA